MNVVSLIGRLSREVETRYTKAGKPVSNLSVAISDSYLDKASGEKVEKAYFFDVTVFGNQAENCGKYLVKGQKVAIEGKLIQETWTDKETNKTGSKVVIIANRVGFLEKPKGSQDATKGEEFTKESPIEDPWK